MSLVITARTPNTTIRRLWEIISGLHAKSFCVISAMRGNRTPEQNAAKDAQLRNIFKSLRLKCVPINGVGQEIQELVDAKGDTTKTVVPSNERSYLVAGVTRKQAESLDRHFDQDYVVYGENGKAQLLGWDREKDVFDVVLTWDDVAFYKERSYDNTVKPPKNPDGQWNPDRPGTATFKSDDARQPGVGFTFFNESGIADAIREAAERLQVKKEITAPIARIERAWLDYSKEIEQAVRSVQLSGEQHKALHIMTQFRKLVRDGSRDPENLVRFLEDRVKVTPAETSRVTQDKVLL